MNIKRPINTNHKNEDLLFATILLVLVVFGGSAHALRENVSNLSLEEVIDS